MRSDLRVATAVVPGCENVIRAIFLYLALGGEGGISDPNIIVRRRLFTSVLF